MFFISNLTERSNTFSVYILSLICGILDNAKVQNRLLLISFLNFNLIVFFGLHISKANLTPYLAEYLKNRFCSLDLLEGCRNCPFPSTASSSDLLHLFTNGRIPSNNFCPFDVFTRTTLIPLLTFSSKGIFLPRPQKSPNVISPILYVLHMDIHNNFLDKYILP